jgi:hypothetical protein
MSPMTLLAFSQGLGRLVGPPLAQRLGAASDASDGRIFAAREALRKIATHGADGPWAKGIYWEYKGEKYIYIDR